MWGREVVLVYCEGGGIKDVFLGFMGEMRLFRVKWERECRMLVGFKFVGL